MDGINQAYQPLLTYLTDIMYKLQKQSALLKHENVRLCLSNLPNQTNNASCFRNSKTIVMGLEYLKKLARHGEDMVAATLAHELSHIVYRKNYNFYGLSKEEEVFADMYGVILRHRAGYNCKVNHRFSKLSADYNETVHPQDTIRRLIIKRVASSLDTRNKKLTPFKVAIPTDVEFVDTFEVEELEAQNVAKQTQFSQKLLTDIDIRNEAKNAREERKVNDYLVDKLLSSRKLKNRHEALLKSVNLEMCSAEQCLKLYEKVKQADDLKKNAFLMMLFRDAFNYICFREDKNLYPDILKKLDNYAIKTAEMSFIHMEPEVTKEYLKGFLDIRYRFENPKHRYQICGMYAQSFHEQYGPDDGSDKYARLLKEEINTFNGKIQSGDAVALAQALCATLKINDRHMPILHNFVKRNSFELCSLRTEALITECLLNKRQAQMTLEYLTGIRKKAFRFRGVYNKKMPVSEDSYVTSSMLKEIKNDWAEIHPSKRAGLFSLIMENISPEDNLQKLDLFADKKVENNDIYKQLMHAYINTYKKDQQAYVAATLVSLKDIDKPFGYEDYFKALLLHSGIDGRRVYDALYDGQSSQCIDDIYHNSLPLYMENNIIFSHIRQLGVSLKNYDDDKLCQIGKQIVAVTQPKRVVGIQKEM